MSRVRGLLGMAQAVALALVAACGDNQPLYRAHDLVIVAHADDDLLFMQPDLHEVIASQVPTTIVYVTAGDGGAGLAFANARAAASRASYGLVAGSQAWTCATAELAGHAAEHCRLRGAELSLVFLGLPDGGVSGERPGSLLKLWDGTVDHADTIADTVATYDREGLIATLATIVDATHPTVIRTLDIAGTHGDDHADHQLVGALTMAAVAAAGSDAALLAYRGYNINYDPPNLPESIYDEVSVGMRAYEACLIGGAVCGVAAAPVLSDPRYVGFLHRHYVVGVRQPPLAGVLRTAAGCVGSAGDRITLGDCARATVVHLTRDGNIRIGDRCVHLHDDGRTSLGACGAGADRHFLFDDEGHVWSGLPPARGASTAVDHSLCLVGDREGVHGAVCGASQDVQWELVRHVASSARPVLGSAARGRTIRLADLTGDGKADLCSIGGGRLVCAEGDGTGRFATPHPVGDRAAHLAIEPESLALGDVDGDGRTDACGRTAQGLACATAASGFAAEPWSPALAHTGTATASDRSLAILDGEICGLTAGNVVCVARGDRTPEVRSTWPRDDATLWPADLDGDGAADWCVATADGPTCGLAADRDVTTDGMLWGFAEDQQIEGSVATDGTIPDSARGALADISGDGRADLCVLVAGNVECAISSGSSFGPRAVVLQLPAGSVPRALWLGDIDGDGKADPCVDDGVSITCAASP